MGHGRAITANHLFSRTIDGARTPELAKAGKLVTEATTCAASSTLDGAKAPSSVFTKPGMGNGDSGPIADGKPAIGFAGASRDVPLSCVPTYKESNPRPQESFAAASHPTAAIRIAPSCDGRVNRSAVVLGAIYGLILALLLLNGCAAQPVSSSAGIDRAAGTGLQINDHADAVLRDLRRMP